MKKGFTFIEILVVVGIIGILTTMGIASYNKFNERRIIKRAVNELKIHIRMAGSRAANNEKDCFECGGIDNNCITYDPVASGDRTLEGWYLELSPTPRIYGRCGENEGDSILFGEKTFLTDIEGLTISGDIADGVLFIALSQETDLPGDLRITINKGDEYFYLLLDQSGNIYEE